MYVVSRICYHLQWNEQALKYICTYLQISVRSHEKIANMSELQKKKHFLNSFEHTYFFHSPCHTIIKNFITLAQLAHNEFTHGPVRCEHIW